MRSSEGQFSVDPDQPDIRLSEPEQRLARTELLQAALRLGTASGKNYVDGKLRVFIDGKDKVENGTYESHLVRVTDEDELFTIEYIKRVHARTDGLRLHYAAVWNQEGVFDRSLSLYDAELKSSSPLSGLVPEPHAPPVGFASEHAWSMFLEESTILSKGKVQEMFLAINGLASTSRQ